MTVTFGDSHPAHTRQSPLPPRYGWLRAAHARAIATRSASVGCVPSISSTQPGDKIQANTPLGGIAPKDARAVVRMEIAERDRAFLREGLPVKLKFTAFPYQRYGFIDGTLVFISPATQPGAATKEPVYEGHVTLDRDHYVVAETKYPVRYGMTATAEIVVRERRLIDLALDPFREIAG